MHTESFYEQLDVVFDKMYEKYGFTDDLIHHKQLLIALYDKENSYRTSHIFKETKVQQFYIDENGYIKSK
jgi:hypothetical protein